MKFSQMLQGLMVIVLLLSVQQSIAETPQEMAANKKIIAAKLLKVNPQFKMVSFNPSAIEGFYTVQLESGPKIYISKSGNHLFDGNLLSIENGVLVNLTEKEAAVDRAGLMKELNPAEMIVFSPKLPVKTKTYITVYTDVDCGYCQKLHQEVPMLNAHGVEVRYMAFPRAGVGSPTYTKLVSAWCSANKQEALTKLKNRESIPEKTCNNPVARQYDLGQKMGINGTPAILLKDGNLIPGYRPAPDIIKILGI